MNKSLIKQGTILLIKFLILFLLESVIFFYLNMRWETIIIKDFNAAFLLILVLSILNMLFWPLVSYISLRFLVFTFGFGTFLLDGFLIWFISYFFDGITVEGSSLFVLPLLLAIITSILMVILDINADHSYYNFMLKRQLERRNESVSERSGFIFLEIDGLARKVLDKALSNGDMPTLKKWLDEGTHKLTSWETDLSSQTGASQAGILHGNNENLVAFRWVEKENDNKIVSSNGLSDASKIEENISNNKGLLSCHGASRSNLFSGDADDFIFTYSKFGSLGNFYTKTWYYIYSSPYNLTRIIILLLWDFVLEFASRIRQLVLNIKPRLRRNLAYFIARGGANVVLREATTQALIGDIFAGEYNVMYATYMGYDEIAHHSGIEDYDSFNALQKIDKEFKRLEDAVNNSKRDYNLIVLSDHGQSNGPTFKQKYGITLNDLVKSLLPENISMHSILDSNDDHFKEQFNLKKYAKLNKEKFDNKFKDKKERLSNVKHKINSLGSEYDEIILDKSQTIIKQLKGIAKENDMAFPKTKREVIKDDSAQTIVLASGNLGLIYFTDWKYRLTYEELEDAFPDLINGLINHPGIGFIMVKSTLYGTLVLSKDGTYFLDHDKHEGEKFLDRYGKNVVQHLKRTNSFDHVPDILVNSTYDSDKDEVYAFEELIGSHGGVGGTQQEPFILYPSSWSLNHEIIGAQEVNKFFKEQISNAWRND